MRVITYMTRFAYGATAGDLDDRRLGLQREEALKVIDHLTGVETDIPSNHPVLRMWEGYEYALCVYGMFVSMEWVRRGFEDTIFWKIREILMEIGGSYETPPWTHDKDILRSHRSNLMRRWPAHYKKKWQGTPENMPYLWPLVDVWEDSGYRILISRADKEKLQTGERQLPDRIARRVENL